MKTLAINSQVLLDAFQPITNPTNTRPGSKRELNLKLRTADIRRVVRGRWHQVPGIPIKALVMKQS
jgi:hypothetical protein